MKPLYESRKASFERAVYRPNSNVIAPPVAAVFATGAMGERMKQEPPQTVFFRVFPDLTVKDGAGVPVGTLYDCLDGTRSAVPVLYLDDLSVSQALVSFVWENALGDAALCVPIALAKQAEELFLRVPHLRRILDCRAVGVGADWFAVSERAWSVGAVGLLISADQTDWDTLNLLHERGHSIWCDAAGQEAAAVFAGADGILTDFPARVYGILRALPEHSRTRRYRLLAHKGYQDEYRLPENSIRAVVRGAELGLDGAEIDIKLTRDGIPFVIHNPTTKAMLTGEERVVETLTAAELEARERTDFPGERTDRLEKMLAAVSCRPHYPVFVEFKPAQKFYHIERMAHAVREILARTGTERGIVVLGEADEMRCLANLLPGQPKLAGRLGEAAAARNARGGNRTALAALESGFGCAGGALRGGRNGQPAVCRGSGIARHPCGGVDEKLVFFAFALGKRRRAVGRGLSGRLQRNDFRSRRQIPAHPAPAGSGGGPCDGCHAGRNGPCGTGGGMVCFAGRHAGSGGARCSPDGEIFLPVWAGNLTVCSSIAGGIVI